MNKTELINAAAEKAGVAKKDAEKILNASLEAITEAMVAGEKVQVSGFGTFESKQRGARVGRNPQTKETIEIPATKVPTFKPSQTLKNIIAK